VNGLTSFFSQRRKERKADMCLLLNKNISFHSSSFAGLAALRELIVVVLNRVKPDRIDEKY
jgi:hypothetical protein